MRGKTRGLWDERSCVSYHSGLPPGSRVSWISTLIGMSYIPGILDAGKNVMALTKRKERR